MKPGAAQRGYGKPTGNNVIAELRRGATLYLCFRNGRTTWQLSTGVFVPDGAAKAVVEHPNIIGGDAGLFNDAPAQTYRWRP